MNEQLQNFENVQIEDTDYTEIEGISLTFGGMPLCTSQTAHRLGVSNMLTLSENLTADSRPHSAIKCKSEEISNIIL